MDLNQLDRVAGEVARALSSVLNEHQKEAEEIEHRYQAKYYGLAIKGWLSASALIIPHIAPLITTASLLPAIPAVMLAGTYAQTKLEERREKRKLAHSVLGLIATADETPRGAV